MAMQWVRRTNYQGNYPIYAYRKGYNPNNDKNEASYKDSSAPKMWLKGLQVPGERATTGRFTVNTSWEVVLGHRDATNGNYKAVGFCSWDMDTTETRASVVTLSVDGRPIEAIHSCYHWNRYAGPIVMSGKSNSSEIKLFDIRDGEMRLKWNTGRNLEVMEQSTPMEWISNQKVLTILDNYILVWDVEAQRTTPTIRLPQPSRR
ncbi:hypothetical protein PanWU01x14_151140 [Parasponia andersonii]|uniref:At4g14310 8-bladed propeller domain-containing protein n=1 Tax=Parasponia andersonii TaxID=3476 RepID=A0A2P5CI20_PARAD|nr:hypothetical protein PanWU01x14_151140 [Parasponia andersonii]